MLVYLSKEYIESEWYNNMAAVTADESAVFENTIMFISLEIDCCEQGNICLAYDQIIGLASPLAVLIEAKFKVSATSNAILI